MSVNEKASFINGLIGKPYCRTGVGPDAYNCWSLTHLVQKQLYGRDLPLFLGAYTLGRLGIVAAIQSHPERQNWQLVPKPVDGCIVTMAKQHLGYHVGTYISIDGGLIFHCIGQQDEPGVVCGPGVCAESVFQLETFGWRRLRWLVPV